MGPGRKGKTVLITLIVILIVLAYFVFKAIRFGELRIAESSIAAVLCIGICAYFIYFIATAV